jgi:hypothetical protein
MGLIAVFFLIRPPVLLFWNYGLGMAESTHLEQTAQQDSPLLTKPMQPVPLPTVLAQPWPAAPASSPALMQLEQDIFDLTVNERTQRQKTPLSSDSGLAGVAAQHSRNMLTVIFLAIPRQPVRGQRTVLARVYAMPLVWSQEILLRNLSPVRDRHLSIAG